MIGKQTVLIKLFGLIPIFSYTTRTVGPTAKEIAARLAPKVLQDVRNDEKLVDAIGEKIAVKFKDLIQEALGGGLDV